MPTWKPTDCADAAFSAVLVAVCYATTMAAVLLVVRPAQRALLLLLNAIMLGIVVYWGCRALKAVSAARRRLARADRLDAAHRSLSEELAATQAQLAAVQASHSRRAQDLAICPAAAPRPCAADCRLFITGRRQWCKIVEDERLRQQHMHAEWLRHHYRYLYEVGQLRQQYLGADEPMDEPADVPAAEPAAETLAEPVAEPADAPAAEPAAEPMAEPMAAAGARLRRQMRRAADGC